MKVTILKRQDPKKGDNDFAVCVNDAAVSFFSYKNNAPENDPYNEEVNYQTCVRMC